MPYSIKRNRYYPSLLEQPDRFWAKVDRRSPDECWEWQGCVSTSGYGRAGKCGYAHRTAYEISTGQQCGSMFVLHSCDNPRCCNPAHLSLGDAGDNARDMASKGRVGGGQKLKLSPEIVRNMRDVGGYSFRAIGRMLGATHGAAARAYREPS